MFGIEVANLIAVGTSQYVVSYDTPSPVAAADASIPASRFVPSLARYAVTREYGETEARHRLPVKLMPVAAMVFGVWLVS